MTTPMKQLYPVGPGGGGGPAGPTVVYLDDIGLADSFELKVAQSDYLGFRDTSALAVTQSDYLGMKDGGVITGIGTPQYQGAPSTAGLSAAGSSLTCNIPPGTVVGELLLAFVDTANLVAVGAAFPVTPAGWTASLAADNSVAGTLVAVAQKSYYRIATGTEGASVTFSFSQSAGQANAEIHRLSGFNTSNPVDVSAVAQLLSTGLTTDPVSPSVTTSTTNTMVFRHLAHYHAALTQTHTPPASHNERTDFEDTVLAAILGSTTDTIIKGAAGATGTAVHDCTETVATDAVMMTLAIAPGTLTITL